MNIINDVERNLKQAYLAPPIRQKRKTNNISIFEDVVRPDFCKMRLEQAKSVDHKSQVITVVTEYSIFYFAFLKISLIVIDNVQLND